MPRTRASRSRRPGPARRDRGRDERSGGGEPATTLMAPAGSFPTTGPGAGGSTAWALRQGRQDRSHHAHPPGPMARSPARGRSRLSRSPSNLPPLRSAMTAPRRRPSSPRRSGARPSTTGQGCAPTLRHRRARGGSPALHGGAQECTVRVAHALPRPGPPGDCCDVRPAGSGYPRALAPAPVLRGSGRGRTRGWAARCSSLRAPRSSRSPAATPGRATTACAASWQASRHRSRSGRAASIRRRGGEPEIGSEPASSARAGLLLILQSYRREQAPASPRMPLCLRRDRARRPRVPRHPWPEEVIGVVHLAPPSLQTGSRRVRRGLHVPRVVRRCATSAAPPQAPTKSSPIPSRPSVGCGSDRDRRPRR